MKTLLIKAIVCCAALVPFTQVKAAEAPARNYYNLPPGTKFTLTTKNVVSTKAGLDGRAKQCPVPTGVPKFTKGKKVTFTIGSKGELKGPNNTFSTAFKSASADTTVYVDKQVGTKLPDTAAVKTSLVTKKATYTQLAFHKVTGSGFGTTVYFVVYTFE